MFKASRDLYRAAFVRLVCRPAERRLLPLLVLVILFFTAPLLAQAPSPTENVLTRTVWWATQWALLGAGATLAAWGLLIAAFRNVFPSLQGKSWIRPVLGGALVFMIPSIIKLLFNFFNTDPDASGGLNNMVLEFGFGD